MLDTTRNALNLWAYQLVPSLFPFMILSNLFLKLSHRYIPINNKILNNFCRYVFGLSVQGCYILFLGHICGYPLGAKMTADAYKNKQISQHEAEYLLTICNQSSPAFLEFYVGVYALNYFIPVPSLLFLFYFAGFLTSLVTRHIYPSKQNISNLDCVTTEIEKSKTNLFSHFDQSISESCITILRVGGYIVIFSLFSNILLSQTIIPKNMIYPLAATLEITNGLFLLKTSYISSSYYSHFVLALSAFGGFCTMAQIKGMLAGTSLSLKPYIIGKMIYTFILLALSFLFIKINIFDFRFQCINSSLRCLW